MRILGRIVLTLLIAPWIFAAAWFLAALIIPPSPILTLIMAVVVPFATCCMIAEKF